MTPKRLLSLILLLALLAPLAAACSSGATPGAQRAYTMAPLVQMPREVQQARSATRHAYQFAAHNPHVLQELPCYCGCVAMGHLSNYDCYIAGSDEKGELTFDNHALGCQICVDITQDAMRLLDEGQSIDDIYAYVDATYSRVGPATPLR